MKLRLIISVIYISYFTTAQSIKEVNHLIFFMGCDRFCMHSYEEGVVFTWHWDDNRTIMLIKGSDADLVFPQEYYTSNIYHNYGIITTNATNASKTLFAKKEVIPNECVCIMYYNFTDIATMDSLSRYVKEGLLCELKIHNE